jgi:peptidoglycan/xylan/chitin deacetylase (PgdA/CDA1 family)
VTGTRHPALVEGQTRGFDDARRYLAGEIRLEEADIGRFSSDARLVSLVARRALLTLRVPPRLLALARPFAVRAGRTDVFDRFVTRYAYWYGVRGALGSGPAWQGLLRAPIILMYHAIGKSGERPSCYVVPRRRFRMEMWYLRWGGFNVISLRDLVAHLKENRIPPARSVVITFDDGFSDNDGEGRPVLAAYGFPATVFAVSDGVGRTAWWADDSALAGRPLLTATQLARLTEASCDIGAHTRTHPSLAQIPVALQQQEIAGSRADLSVLTGRAISAFAYPFGDYAPATLDYVKRAGFAAACCSRSGAVDPASPMYELPRVEVRGTDSVLDFVLLLWRGHRIPAKSSSVHLKQVPA